ncbi:uncharacterized protein TM35_000061190 [Trypanosoma theileri]|uniref:LisH domain-containing protein n=1 Tax=Trypanosoma theileri TaxID=67003 RepID=A0A1X0P2E1_9TRYP|nr:uncharacterized protein TM35_000061190 [Trypanosoma theileri]ORC91114.1 hypothetical protein TM35_000061190 [Trypanosoma theileri]
MEEHPVEEDVNEINTTLLELQDALTAALRETGVLGKLRAQLRASAISVVRGDSHLRDAAVSSAGKIMQPASLSLEARVALLLMEDFMRVHGLLHTIGVFEAESNVCLIGETERATMKEMQSLQQQQQQQQQQSSGEKSILEKLIANTLQRDKPIILQGTSTGSSSLSLTPPEHSVQPSKEIEIEEEKEKEEKGKEQQQQSTIMKMGMMNNNNINNINNNNNNKEKEKEKEKKEEQEVPHNIEIIDELKEYDDSVDFSDISIEDISSMNKTSYDYMENF